MDPALTRSLLTNRPPADLKRWGEADEAGCANLVQSK